MENKQLIIDKTPKDQSKEDKQLITRLTHMARTINEASKGTKSVKELVMRHIVSLEEGGEHTPDNLELLDKAHFHKIKKGLPTVGAINISHIQGKKKIRYAGHFVSGVSMQDQKDVPETKEDRVQSEEDNFTPMYIKLNDMFDERSHDYFQEAIALIGRTAHLYASPTRAELSKWCDRFGSYYKPKLTSVEQQGDVDSAITITLRDERSKEVKVIEEVEDDK